MVRLRVESSGTRQELDTPSAEDVAAAIQALNSDGEVGLGEPTGISLGVAGGPDGFFVGYSDAQLGLALQARATDPDGQPVEAVVGGQSTRLPPEYLVSQAVATEAALHFLAKQEPAPTVAWDRV